MPVPIEQRYQHAFEQMRFTSEIRFKILAAWGATYAALAAIFAWVHKDPSLQSLGFSVPIIAIGITWLFWLGDKRNGYALGAALESGRAIEDARESAIPEGQRYFQLLPNSKNKEVKNKEKSRATSHGCVILIFSIITTILLSFFSGYLFCNSRQNLGKTSLVPPSATPLSVTLSCCRDGADQRIVRAESQGITAPDVPARHSPLSSKSPCQTPPLPPAAPISPKAQ